MQYLTDEKKVEALILSRQRIRHLCLNLMMNFFKATECKSVLYTAVQDNISDARSEMEKIPLGQRVVCMINPWLPFRSIRGLVVWQSSKQ